MTPSQSGLTQISRLQQGFRRDSPDRVSLTKKHMDHDGQPRTVWSPQTMTPKRTTSNMQAIAPSGAAASAITRRPDNYTESNLHLRSRSQSPNHMLLNQQQNIRAPVNTVSRDLTKELQRRRDSDMSYTAVSTRLTPASSRTNLRDTDTRKSTEALNRIAALRSK
ncbi:unnamed protein product [Strongylus vulgaris]|uniref:Uncharacterized protein n=1 Tax=Strongylus vulgaris TaxID=40348 RepID=A0A3P7LIZ7_STRVU|nr:unnamed protein product [Strongylus vulgaris]